MRHLLLLAFVCLFSLPLAAQDQDSRYWEGVVYFQLRPELNLKLDSYDSEKITRRPLSSTYKDFPQVLSVLENNQVQKLDQAFKSLSTPAAKNIYRLDFDNKENVASILKTLRGSSRIAYAERAPKNYTSALPNDAEIGRQWYLETIEAEAGWDLAVPQREVVVAVVDDAVSIEHEDLEANVWRNTTEINGTRGVDDDGNGYVDDFFGWDGAMNDNNPNPPSNANDQYFMHGTHVAGIVGGQPDAATIGVTDNVEFMMIRTVPNGDERDKDVANSIRYAVDNGAMVINMSFGKEYSPDQEYVREAVKYAENAGVLMVHAAGNDGKNNDEKLSFPDGSISDRRKADSWIEVGASSSSYDESLPASFSNYGENSVDLFAPGVQILSSVADNGYESLSGTSMASPVVAGVAALLMSYFPELEASDIKEILMESVTKIDLEVLQPTEGDEEVRVPFSSLSRTGGIVNAYEAVKLADQRATIRPR